MKQANIHEAKMHLPAKPGMSMPETLLLDPCLAVDGGRRTDCTISQATDRGGCCRGQTYSATLATRDALILSFARRGHFKAVPA